MRNAPSRALLVGLVTLALVASCGAPVAGAAPSPSVAADASAAESLTAESLTAEPLAAGSAAVEQIEEPFDPATATRIRIEPTPDRDARWTVSVRYALTDETDRAAFDAAGSRFVDGEIGPDATLFERLAREASQNVDRRMRIEDVDREAVVHEDTASFDVADAETTAVGELRLTFVWTGFLEADGENLELGDALTTADGGTWLTSLEEGQTLEVATPEGYTVTGTSDAIDRLSDNAVIIEGPRVFGEEEEVAVVYAPAGTATPPWGLLTAAILVGAVLIAGSIIGYRRIDGGTPGVAETVADEGAVDSDGGKRSDRERLDDGAPGNPEPATDGAAATEEEEEDLSLLSDEERVERLLKQNGGRMRQADIVSETGWSDAKVSQLLSAMADSGRVEKLRLGRENLISIPDDEDDGDDLDGGS